MGTDAILDDLRWRGLIADITHEAEFRKALRDASEPVVAYCGFDPTASSLHVGSLIPLLVMARWQRHGHRPIMLAGGGTGLIGDPSGKSSERELKNEEWIKTNTAGIREQLGRFVDFGASKNAALLVDNGTWLKPMTLISFLRDVGKHFSVNMMIQKDSVRARLEEREQGISYTEFSYMLLQSYDFLHLHKEYGCRAQIGGSDQWGNVTTGIDLIRRTTGEQTFGLVVPLLLNSAGQKFGKSEGGNIWLDANQTSPYQFYQFWVRTEDADVGKLLRYYTFLDRPTIEVLDEATKSAPERRDAQRRLAREMTTMIHGAEATAGAERASAALFGGTVDDLSSKDWTMLASEVPSTALSAGMPAEFPLVDLLVLTGQSSSKGQARKDIAAGGVYLNNLRTTLESAATSATDWRHGHILLRKGKANYHVVKRGGSGEMAAGK